MVLYNYNIVKNFRGKDMNVMDNFVEISPYEVENTIKLIGKDWMLITARDGEKVNAMTASWGALGELWHKPVAIGFVRPQRHTFGLTENEERVTLAFLDEEYRDALKLCGTKSGRDMDKLAASGLTSFDCEGVPAISESKLILVVRKLYADYLKEECFVDQNVLVNYPNKDYHRVYVWEIQKAFVRK